MKERAKARTKTSRMTETALGLAISGAFLFFGGRPLLMDLRLAVWGEGTSASVISVSHTKERRYNTEYTSVSYDFRTSGGDTLRGKDKVEGRREWVSGDVIAVDYLPGSPSVSRVAMRGVWAAVNAHLVYYGLTAIGLGFLYPFIPFRAKRKGQQEDGRGR